VFKNVTDMRSGCRSIEGVENGRCAVYTKVTDMWSECRSTYIVGSSRCEYVQKLPSSQDIQVYIYIYSGQGAVRRMYTSYRHVVRIL
jgi:hypothetical protein